MHYILRYYCFNLFSIDENSVQTRQGTLLTHNDAAFHSLPLGKTLHMVHVLYSPLCWNIIAFGNLKAVTIEVHESQ